MRITFLGAAQEVTGSAYLVEASDARLLVDCGLFQGGRSEREKNWHALDCDVRNLDLVIVTHAHLDHCGLLPVLVRRGYHGPVYATNATADLMSIMLRDSAHIMEKEIGWREGKRHERAPEGARPLYTVLEAERALARVHGMPYRDRFQPRRTVSFQFDDAGHILGAAIVSLWIEDAGRMRKLVFSGDLGQPARPVVRDPTPISEADVLLIESTYGDRRHRGMDETVDELVEVVNDTLYRRRGNVIVPAFAVGRTQELLVLLVEQALKGRLRGFDVYVDSPLATKATEVTLKHKQLLDQQSQRLLADPGRAGLPIRVRFIDEVPDSKKLNAIRSGAVIIAGSGMCDGGRIKHHLAYNIHREECAVLFTGFQAKGTLGRRIVERAETVRIYGQDYPVRASVHTLGGLSAHADRDALFAWLGNFTRAPEQVFVVHGEAQTALGFAQEVKQALRWPAIAPAAGQVVAC
jgi:metallo-beta-lactamase family protein